MQYEILGGDDNELLGKGGMGKGAQTKGEAERDKVGWKSRVVHCKVKCVRSPREPEDPKLRWLSNSVS